MSQTLKEVSAILFQTKDTIKLSNYNSCKLVAIKTSRVY